MTPTESRRWAIEQACIAHVPPELILGTAMNILHYVETGKFPGDVPAGKFDRPMTQWTDELKEALRESWFARKPRHVLLGIVETVSGQKPSVSAMETKCREWFGPRRKATEAEMECIARANAARKAA